MHIPEHLPQIQYGYDDLSIIAFGLIGSAIGCIFVLLFSYFEFNKYGVRAHDLRAFAITKLTLEGVSPFIIYEITRHSIPGLSDVLKIYKRPSVEDVIQTMELI